jgi:hypothetical protein
MGQEFVNINGELFDMGLAAPAPRVKRKQPDSYHKGYRVLGVPPRDLEHARRKHLEVQATEKNPKEWDELHWLMNARKKAVNPRPYELRAGAEQCAELAIRERWRQVEIVELMKGHSDKRAR